MGSKRLAFFKNNVFLLTLVISSLGLALSVGQPVTILPSFVDWNTIFTLSGLLILTMGIKESGFFYYLAYRISRRINNERKLALFLIFVAAALSVFLTNDIALFIVVPLTLDLQEFAQNDYTKMIIFEAIAVNVGSALTPIGNPQNIFLWHQWQNSFPNFVLEMLPLVFLMAFCLFVFVVLVFPPEKIKTNHVHYPGVRRGLFYVSAVLLFVFILLVEFGFERYALPVLFILFFAFYRKVVFKSDWGLIVLFVFIFIDIGLLRQLEGIQQLLNHLDFSNPLTVLLSGSLLSQFISNVPATILLSHYSANFKLIAYGVNMGGNGLLIASFANIIALRFIKDKSKYLVFHKYSVPFFIGTFLAVLILGLA